DTGPSESFTFDIWYQDQGRYTRNGATVGNPLIQPQTINFSITDSSGTLNNFTAVLSGVSGKIINVYESDKPSSASEFVIQSGNLTVTGSGFTINLSYSANKAVGTFSGPGFLADYYINENGVYDAYYIISGDSYNKKNFVGWDFP
ncbi:MAG: hypothetical protein LBQ47_08505, partial [Endomicrobium sp.]|nr:hypothetical protein [Endomicrobium sp.]